MIQIKIAMKKIWKTILLLVVFGILAVFCSLWLMKLADALMLKPVVIRPALDNSLLINPGKGFVEYYGTTADTKSVIGVGYSRCDWSVLEPAEGVYNWSPIDGFIAAYASYGLKIGWRVMNYDTGVGVQHATPAWVFKSGTNTQTGSVYPVGAVSVAIPDPSSPSGNQIVPANMDDPVFLARMKDFITAFGKSIMATRISLSLTSGITATRANKMPIRSPMSPRSSLKKIISNRISPRFPTHS